MKPITLLPDWHDIEVFQKQNSRRSEDLETFIEHRYAYKGLLSLCNYRTRLLHNPPLKGAWLSFWLTSQGISLGKEAYTNVLTVMERHWLMTLGTGGNLSILPARTNGKLHYTFGGLPRPIMETITKLLNLILLEQEQRILTNRVHSKLGNRTMLDQQAYVPFHQS